MATVFLLASFFRGPGLAILLVVALILIVSFVFKKIDKSSAAPPAAEVFNSKNIKNRKSKKMYLDADAYDKYIVIPNCPEETFLASAREYSALRSGARIRFQFLYAFKSLSDQNVGIILKCPDNLDGFNYHNLMIWLSGATSATVSAVAIHKIDKAWSYCAFTDPHNENGDSFILQFWNGKRGFAYIPEFDGNVNIDQEKSEAAQEQYGDKALNMNDFAIFNVYQAQALTLDLGSE